MGRLLQMLPLFALLVACERHPVALPDLPTLEAMRPALSRSLTPQEAERTFGPPDQITGSGLLIYVYDIEQGFTVHLGFPGYAPITYAKLRTPGSGVFHDIPLND